MIDLTKHEATLDSAVTVARDKSIRIPTFKQMRDPSLIPGDVKADLRDVGLWDLDPLNLRLKSFYGLSLYVARQYDQAIRQFQTVISVNPGYPQT